MRTTQTPPPPPPPGINQSRKLPPTPRPSHAAIPYSLCPPVQETSPPLEALYRDPALSSTTPGQSPPQLKEEQDVGPPHSIEATGPVQETDPAPQTQVRSEEEESAG
ncbi:uncharacterized protein LOC130527265 isoform X1 [Takifugu flavidus]|uniref:uncharacterized protein LOC130527265 isoform X1 n=1 Tax=Takifugu flavidus TaxID=433684 RepID=UPI00254409F7|nr:uncharacterized protein LOC130527265 isoform X1 [Takifugu flavidus]